MIKRDHILMPRRNGKTWLTTHSISNRLRAKGDHEFADLLDRALANLGDQS